MERDEFKILVKGMKAVYAQPTFIPDQDAFNVWFGLLKDIDYQVCNFAIQKWMLTNKFPPTIAEIREYAASVVNGEPMTWGESWKAFKKAVNSFGMNNEKKALESLDPITRKCAEYFGYREFCLSDVENEMADRAHYQRIFEQVAKREQMDKQLSAPLLEAISNVRLKGVDGQPLQIGNGGDKQ